MPVTNEEILGAIKAQDGNIEQLKDNVSALCVSIGKLEQWRNNHEKRANGFEKAISTLRTRINTQGAVIGIGEIIIAAIAILKGGS